MSRNKTKYLILIVIIIVDIVLISLIAYIKLSGIWDDNEQATSQPTELVSESTQQDSVTVQDSTQATTQVTTQHSDDDVTEAVATTENITQQTEAAKTADEPITLAFGGDVLFDRGVKNLLRNYGNDAVFPMQYAQPFIDADIAMVNLETAISTRGEAMADKKYTFRSDPESLSILTNAGIDIVSLSNNHTLDYGRDALSDTFDYLNSNEIKYVGAGNNYREAIRWEIIEAKGKKFAFLAASAVIPSVDWYATVDKSGLFGMYDITELKNQTELAKKEADYVILYVHWGTERVEMQEKKQTAAAHELVESGADMIIGSHPHVLQGIEYYKGKLIAYSLGNFIFTDASKDTMVLTVEVTGEKFITSIIPYQIKDLKTTQMTDTKRLAALRDYLQANSPGTKLTDDWVFEEAKSN